jgi:hypothetical protein
MLVVFYVDAYFTLGGEVLLYFSVGVEVIEIVNLIRIQIGLKFRKYLKNKKPFSFFLLAMGRNSLTGPAWLCFSPHVHSPRSSTKEFHHARPRRPPAGPAEPSWLGVADPRTAARPSSSQTRIALGVFPFGLNLTNVKTRLVEGSK